MLTNKLPLLLVKNKLKAKNLSLVTGIAESTLSNFINEKSDIKLSTLIKLADYFKVPLSELIEYVPESHQD
ncbi:helix-turn-helix transcriptional regulator [Lactococcus ileimucosae]|uniref:Helix-turn-helix transcriptional regulator n=1 Tax=Lactococcus ileimucosae TaxID=2941329 RepID=A0ABV4D4K5_9LACT